MRSPLLVALVALVGCGPGVDPGDGGGLLPDCAPVDDGQLTVDELPLAPGVSSTLTRNAPGDLVHGAPEGADGVDRDFSEGPEDVGLTFELVDPADAWWGDRFPGATHAAPSAVELPELLAVQRLDEDGLWLLGLVTASPQDPDAKTEVHYDEPVAALRFPLEPGAAWGQTAEWRGLVSGVPNQGVEDWSATVGAVETVRLPGGVELSEVLPVDIALRQDFALAAGASTVLSGRRAWYAGCFGEVASWVAESPDSDEATEYRRLLP